MDEKEKSIIEREKNFYSQVKENSITQMYPEVKLDSEVIYYTIGSEEVYYAINKR